MVVSKYLVVMFTILALLGSILVGCGGAAPTPSEPSEPAGPDPAPDADRMGGTVTVGWGRVITGLDPSVWTSRFDRMLMTQVYTPLIWEAEAYEFAPGMARDWEVNEDYTEITLFLRDDIDLADGSHFDADLLIASWDRILDPATASLQTRQFEDITEYVKVDDYTVKVTFDSPNYRIVNHFADLWSSPNSMAAIEQFGDEYGLNFVSYGPYKIDKWPDETTLIMVRNDDYETPPHMEGPYFDEIVWKIIPEDTSRLVALEGGDVDVIWQPSFHEVRGLELDADFEVATFQTAGLPQGYHPNVTVSPTDEKNVRLALIYALDREEISDLAWFGVTTPAYSSLASTSWAYWEEAEERFGYDPEKANQLLDEAGWVLNSETGVRQKDGKDLTVRFLGSARRDYEISIERWKDVGFDAILEAMAYDAQVSRMADNDYEIARLGLSATDPHVLWSAFHSSQIEGGAQFNRTRIADPTLDELLDTGTEFPDLDSRRAIYVEAQKMILENGWHVPSYEDTYVWAYTTDLQGWTFNLGGNPDFSGMWLDN